MMSQETKFAHKIDDLLKSYEGLWFLNTYGNAVQRAGIPDRIICYKGKFIAIELKRPDGKGRESKRQEIEGFKILNANGIYAVVDSIEQLKSILQKVER